MRASGAVDCQDDNIITFDLSLSLSLLSLM